MNEVGSGVLLRGALDYLLNCAWQAPLLALAAVVVTKGARLSLRGRCIAFAGALTMIGLAPLVPTQRLTGVIAALGPAPAAAVSTPGSGLPASWSLTFSSLAPIGTLAAEGLTLAAGLAVAIAAIRLAVGWLAARRLVRRSRPVRLPEAAGAAMRDFLARSGQAVPPVRGCDGLAGPAVVGAWAPVVLVPPGFEALPQEQLIAALLHECAHVERRDYALNVLCEMLALPSSWHPAAALLKRRFRAAREAACDQLAAAALGSPTRYARCLVELARTVEGGRRASGAALQLLGHGELEDRIRKLTGPAIDAGRLCPLQTAAAVALALGCIAPLTCLHLTPVLRDGRAAREIARVAVFDRTALATPAPLVVARSSSPPAPRPYRTPSRRPGSFVRLRRRASVQLASGLVSPTPLASAAAAPPVLAPAPVASSGVVAPAALALARLDEASDIGRIVFALEIGAVSPCLAPPPRPSAAGATQDAARSPTNAADETDFDPFAPAASLAGTPAPTAVTATSAGAAVVQPTCLKAAALQPARRPGLA